MLNGLIWLWLLHPGLLLVFLALLLLSAWLRAFEELPPQEREHAKGAHGAGIIACGGYLLYKVPAPDDYLLAAYGAYAVLCCLGVFWISIGSARAQIYGDRRLQVRAVTKIVVGLAVWLAWRHYEADAGPAWAFWGETSAMTASLWCWVGGLVQFLICSHQRKHVGAPQGIPEYQGGAKFPGDASGLREGDG